MANCARTFATGVNRRRLPNKTGVDPLMHVKQRRRALASLARAVFATARVVVLSGSDAAGGVPDVDAWVTKGAGIAELLAALRPEAELGVRFVEKA